MAHAEHPEPAPTAFAPEPFLAELRREGAATRAAAARIGLGEPVPTCEGWAVRDVLGHLGRVHRSVSEILERRSTEIPDVAIPKPPADDALVAFFDEGLERLLAALADVAANDPDATLYTWQGPDTVRFYLRRMAHELAIHRLDAESAGTVEPGPFDPAMAVDGVDELFEVLVPFSSRRWERSLPTGTLHLHRTDGPGEWFVSAADGTVRMTHEHTKGDVAVRGSASDLFRFVWNRGRGPGLEVLGDAAVADEWAALAP